MLSLSVWYLPNVLPVSVREKWSNSQAMLRTLNKCKDFSDEMSSLTKHVCDSIMIAVTKWKARLRLF